MLNQLLSGLKHYHDSGVMHRDIKPANVMMHVVVGPGDERRYVFKFTDNGEVRHTACRVKGLAGTAFFCAPEVLDEKRYNERADMFSFGVLLLPYLVDYDPFRDRRFGGGYPKSSCSVQTWMHLVDERIKSDCDPGYQPLVRGTLLRDPRKRWSATKCLVFLNLDPSEKPDQTTLGPRESRQVLTEISKASKVWTARRTPTKSLGRATEGMVSVPGQHSCQASRDRDRCARTAQAGCRSPAARRKRYFPAYTQVSGCRNGRHRDFGSICFRPKSADSRSATVGSVHENQGLALTTGSVDKPRGGSPAARTLHRYVAPSIGSVSEMESWRYPSFMVVRKGRLWEDYALLNSN